MIIHTGISQTGIPTIEEKFCLLLNIPEYWNRLNSLAENEPMVWRDGRKTNPHETFPFANLSEEDRSERIANLRSFRSRWRIKVQFIQPFVFGIVTSFAWKCVEVVFLLFQ